MKRNPHQFIHYQALFISSLVFLVTIVFAGFHLSPAISADPPQKTPRASKVDLTEAHIKDLPGPAYGPPPVFAVPVPPPGISIFLPFPFFDLR